DISFPRWDPSEPGQQPQTVHSTGGERTWNRNRWMARLPAHGYYGFAAQRGFTESGIEHSRALGCTDDIERIRSSDNREFSCSARGGCKPVVMKCAGCYEML